MKQDLVQACTEHEHTIKYVRYSQICSNTTSMLNIQFTVIPYKTEGFLFLLSDLLYSDYCIKLFQVQKYPFSCVQYDFRFDLEEIADY